MNFGGTLFNPVGLHIPNTQVQRQTHTDTHTHPLQMRTLSPLMSELPVPPPRAQHKVHTLLWYLSRGAFHLCFAFFGLIWLDVNLVQNPKINMKIS